MRRREHAGVPGAPALAVVRLSKAYGKHPVLHELSFELVPGTITVLGGVNGIGKSTLLRCLAGLTTFEGRADVAGVPVDGRPSSRRLIGYLPQSVALPDRVTVGEVLAFFARLRGSGEDGTALPEDFLPPAERPVGVLSGGQRQRVALAVALLGHPPLLLLDEPVANLDEGGREGFWETLRALRGRGVASLVASPMPGDLAGVADRSVVLGDGRVVLDEPMEGLHVLETGGEEGSPDGEGEDSDEGEARA